MRLRLPPPGPKRDLILALLLALAAAAFRLPRLGMPHEEIFDEVYHAKSALQYIQGEAPVDWVHPPTSKLLIAVGVKLFGYEPWAWRLAPALAGTALIFVFFFLARRALRSERAALLASILLLCDGVYLVQSRVAMTNIFAVLFQLAAVLFTLRAVQAERLPWRDMLLAGLFVGLALSTRWTSLWCMGFIGLLFLGERGRRVLRVRELGIAVVCFGLLPVLLYAVSYVPYMHIHHRDWTLSVSSFRPFVDALVQEQKNVWGYHANLNATHPYFSPWYTWPWLVRPTWYYYHVEGVARGVIALGNPALWWASVPITLWALITGLRRNDPRRIFAAAGFCLLYLPWGLSPRTLNFSHYLFEAIPYACLSLGLWLDQEWDGRWQLLARGYVLATIGLFLFFFPILTALPIPASVPLSVWAWFRSWV